MPHWERNTTKVVARCSPSQAIRKAAIAEVEAERKSELRRSLILEEIGVVMFLLGLILTIVGALV